MWRLRECKELHEDKEDLAGCLHLSGWHLSTCLPRQYHYVAERRNWTEAQTYCRQTYTDLATIESTEEMNQLINTVSSAGHSSEAWIGLYNDLNWRWSDGFTGSGADYRNWGNGQPYLYSDQKFCISIGTSRISWETHNCDHTHPFICYHGSQMVPKFVGVTTLMTWSDAQKYCRENFVDLATVTNDTENQQVLSKAVSGDWTWIGLFSDLSWSDGSDSTFRHWDGPPARISPTTAECGIAFFDTSGKWSLISCEIKLPFICYSFPTPVKRQVGKLRMKLEDSSVDLNDPAVKANILKQLQDRLEEEGVNRTTLKWREQPDGKVFHKEEERLEPEPYDD